MHSTHEVEPEPTSKHPCSVFQGQCPLELKKRRRRHIGEWGRQGHAHTRTPSQLYAIPGVEAVQA